MGPFVDYREYSFLQQSLTSLELKVIDPRDCCCFLYMGKEGRGGVGFHGPEEVDRE